MAKVMISLPDELLARIDREAERRSTSRSALLQAAKRELGDRDPALIDAAIERAREAASRFGPGDAAQLVRADRHAR